MMLSGLILMIVYNTFSDAEIQTYYMEEHCGAMINMILDSVYQIRLQMGDNYIDTLQSTGPATCQTEVEPWYTWPKLMFYFENLDLDCEFGYLQFFQSTANSTRVKGLEADICGDLTPKGIFMLDEERYLQIRYVARRGRYLEDVFSIIVTAYAEEPCPVHSFKCDNSRCIDREIRCEGYDSCGDGSGCRFDLSSAALAGIIISSLVGLFVLISIVICVVCCMRKNRKSQERVQNSTQPEVIYTATTNSTRTNNPPAYDSGQSDETRQNGINSSRPEPYHSVSASVVPPLNVAAGQSPAYPPNWTMPSYQQNIFRNPPPYEEMETNLPEDNASSDRERENTVNDVLENTTDTVVSEETYSKTVEEPADYKELMESHGSQVMQVTKYNKETEEAEECSEQEDNTTYDIPVTNHHKNERETDQEDSNDESDTTNLDNSASEGHYENIASNGIDSYSDRPKSAMNGQINATIHGDSTGCDSGSHCSDACKDTDSEYSNITLQ